MRNSTLTILRSATVAAALSLPGLALADTVAATKPASGPVASSPATSNGKTESMPAEKAMVAKPAAKAAALSTAKTTQPRHRVIEHSVRQLERTKGLLQKESSRDLEGHRAKAVGAVEQAIQELKLALESDRK